VRGLIAANSARGPREKLTFSTAPKGQVNLLYSMLALQPWCHFGLGVRWLSQDDCEGLHVLAPKMAKEALPAHVPVSCGPLEELEWYATLTKSGRAAALARGEGDTKGEPPEVDVDVPFKRARKKRATKKPAKAKKGRGGKQGAAATAAAAADEEESAALDDGGDDNDDEADDSPPLRTDSPEGDADADAERDHELVDDGDFGFEEAEDEGDFSLSQPAMRGRAVGAAFAVGGHMGALDLAEQKQISDDFAYAQALAASMDDAEAALLHEYAPRDGVAPGTGGAAGARDEQWLAWMERQDDEDEDEFVDMTAERPAAAAAAAAAANHPAASNVAPAASSAAADATRKLPSCQLCKMHAPPPASASSSAAASPSPQLTSFGFEKLLSVCPHLRCQKVAHLLCFQRRMQAPRDADDMGKEYPLLPAPAPCPFCGETVVWCMLVENCHRFHAPAAAAAAAAGGSDASKPPPSNARSIGQYFTDAAVIFKQIARLKLQQIKKQKEADARARAEAKAAKAAETKAKKKGKGAAAASAGASGAIDAPAAAAAASSDAKESLAQLDSLFGRGGVPRRYDNPESLLYHSAAAAAAAAAASAASQSGGKENAAHGAPFLSTPARGAGGGRKRRSRSLTPTRPSPSSQSLAAVSKFSGSNASGALASPPTRPSGARGKGAAGSSAMKPVRSLSVPFALAAANASDANSPAVLAAASLPPPVPSPPRASKRRRAAAAAMLPFFDHVAEAEEGAEHEEPIDLTQAPSSFEDDFEADEAAAAGSSRTGRPKGRHANAAATSASQGVRAMVLDEDEEEEEPEPPSLLQRLQSKYPEQIVLSL